MAHRLFRPLKWTFLALPVVVLLFVGRDTLHLNPAQEAAAPYTYDLIEWEAVNFLDKWVHRVARALPWRAQTRDEKLVQVAEYFRFGEEALRLGLELERVTAQISADSQRRVAVLEAELENIEAGRDRLRADVEETLEATINSIVSDAGIASWGDLTFPPVDIRLTKPPRVLITSPRDRILRSYEVLIDPGITLVEREEVEDALFDGSDLAAVVLDIGGLATFPASIPNDRPLHWTLQIAAHEWLHHYFFFRPLGWNMFDGADMQTLNETAADLTGREIGDLAFERLGGVLPRIPDAGGATEDDGAQVEGKGFDFDLEMRKTRQRVDELLAVGDILEAEAYMEERRGLFVENGFHIRKLNQAYFAFLGTYAENAASVSPIGDQLHRLRRLVPDLGTFIATVAGVSSYQGFLEALERLDTPGAAP